MSRVPFWLVIVFALILCSAVGVTLLHRAGLITLPAGPEVAPGQPLPQASGLLVTGIEHRNPGVLIVSGQAAPKAKITLARADLSETTSADGKGRFTVPLRLPDLKGWAMLQLTAEGHAPLPLAVRLAPKTEQVTALAKADETWRAVTVPEALAIASISELPDGRWQLSGQTPAVKPSRKLLLQLYSDGVLIETAKPDGDAFTLTLLKGARPQKNLRIDIYDTATLQAVIRLNLTLPLDKMFERVPATMTDNAPVWVWRDAAGANSQQADPADLIPGQIVPMPVQPAAN